MYKCENCEKFFKELFEDRCPECGSLKWKVFVADGEECTCVPGDERREACLYCRNKLSQSPIPF